MFSLTVILHGQASLPLHCGGLGVRRLTDVALPAYIASLEAFKDLVCTINRRPNGDRLDRLDSAVAIFRNTRCPDLNTELDLRQRTLVQPPNTAWMTSSPIPTRSTALAPHSGAWLSAIPVESLGLLLPDDALRINVALRLGLRVQQPHRFRCGALTDALSRHSLSCQQNPGRLPRHAALNEVVYRPPAAAGIVATLEPRGEDRGDGRCPDGITVFPFRRGKILMWDATCVNTFCSTHINDCALTAGAAARAAEHRKRRSHEDLVRRYDFSPLAVETSGVLGPDFSDLLNDIGRRIS
ncbi:hypothetical protein E2C01_055384 [Portunus trituberculatus]|uniref:Uncharacterized protein n=1 Tax=Portunus trituberculatus TaxID=210409 RepID=A0A5B7GXK6_PORTR|nr:hypothetical protein [Portunus trituberculatus]